MKISTRSPQFLLFAIGLAVILISITVIQIIQQSVVANTVDPSLINLSGRQRMISQRISKQCFYLEYDIRPKGMSVIDSLKKYTGLLEKVHFQLIDRNNLHVKDKSISELLDQATPFMEALVNSSRYLLEDKDINTDSLFRVIANAEINFLPLMEKVTESFEKKSVSDLRFVRRLDLLLTIVLVLIISSLFVLLYFPILRQLESNNQEMKLANQQLETARKKVNDERILLRTIIDNIPINIYVKDSSSRKTLVNRSEWEYVGAKSEAEVLGKSDHDLYPAGSAVVSSNEDQKVLAGKSIIARETFNFKKDGTEKWFLVSKVPLKNEAGEIVGLVGVSIDVSDSKKANMKLESALQKLAELNEEKNHFMSMATHDLKNPLNSIAGLTSLLRMEKNLEPGAEEIVSKIELTILKMKELISRLLDYNKIERGEAKVNLQQVDLDAFMKERIQTFKEMADAKSISISIHNELKISSMNTDPSMLAQILDNLISNALKFSKTKTKVKIKLAELGNFKVIEVEDQGPGISKEELPKLFLPFTKLSARPTSGESSSGLGLSIVKELVQLLGGTINVNSEEGTGTTFSIALKNE